MLRHRLLPPAEEEAVAASADLASCPLPERPWRLVFRTSGIDLVANSLRLASPRSPRERLLTVGAGCVLHEMREAVRGFGHQAWIQLAPVPSHPTVLASVLIGHGEPKPAHHQSSRPFPLHHLCSIAAREDARLVLLGTKRSNSLLRAVGQPITGMSDGHEPVARTGILATPFVSTSAALRAGIALQAIMTSAGELGYTVISHPEFLDDATGSSSIREEIPVSHHPHVVVSVVPMNQPSGSMIRGTGADTMSRELP
jgi:hypothetical protein